MINQNESYIICSVESICKLNEKKGMLDDYIKMLPFKYVDYSIQKS